MCVSDGRRESKGEKELSVSKQDELLLLKQKSLTPSPLLSPPPNLPFHYSRKFRKLRWQRVTRCHLDHGRPLPASPCRLPLSVLLPLNSFIDGTVCCYRRVHTLLMVDSAGNEKQKEGKEEKAEIVGRPGLDPMKSSYLRKEGYQGASFGRTSLFRGSSLALDGQALRSVQWIRGENNDLSCS